MGQSSQCTEKLHVWSTWSSAQCALQCGARFNVTLRDACLPSKLRHGPKTPLLDPIASFKACTTALFYPHMSTSLVANALPLRQVVELLTRMWPQVLGKDPSVARTPCNPFKDWTLSWHHCGWHRTSYFLSSCIVGTFSLHPSSLHHFLWLFIKKKKKPYKKLNEAFGSDLIPRESLPTFKVSHRPNRSIG